MRRLPAMLALATAIVAPAPAVTAPVRIAWVGGPTMVIRFGPIGILTDPVFGEGPEAFRVYDPNTGKPDVPQDRLAPLPKIRLRGIDLVLVSHTHEDHLDPSAIAKLGPRAEYLVPVSQVAGLRKRGVRRLDGITWGQSRSISHQGYHLTITALAARHSEQAELLPVLGDVNGYWLEFRRGHYRRTIYWTGDSFAPPDGVPANLMNPDLFVPHLGGVGKSGPIGHVSMGSDHAIAFAKALRPKAILPIHHSTFSLYREPIEPFFEAAAKARFRVERLSEGQQLRLN